MRKMILSSLFIVLSISNLSAEEIFRPYVGGDFTMTHFDGEDGFPDSRAGTAGVRFGTDIGEYFGAEARAGIGIIDDDVTAYGEDINLNMNYYIAAFGKVQTPIYDGFRVYGLAGVSQMEAEAKDSFGVSVTEDDNSFAWGLGANYFINNNWAANLEYLSLNQDEDAQSINTGLSYHF
jgi:opacity protein-like surface antigen